MKKQVALITSGSPLQAKNLFDREILTIEDTGLSYRVINHWESNGLLVKRSDVKWRRFDLEDLFWIHTISELREFGFPLKKILSIKQQLFKLNEARSGRATQFSLAVQRFILGEKNIRFIIKHNGEILVATGEFTDESINYSHIIVSFSAIWERVKQSKTISLVYDFDELSEEEVALMLEIREGSYSSVTVHLQNGKVKRYETVKTLASKERAIEQIKQLIKRNPFQEITLQAEEGKIVSIKSKARRIAIGKT